MDKIKVLKAVSDNTRMNILTLLLNTTIVSELWPIS